MVKEFKMKKPLVIFVFTLMLSLSAYADFITTTVKRVAMYADKSILIGTETSINPANCQGITFALSQNLPNYKEMYSLSLIANTTGQKVKFHIHNTYCITGKNAVVGGAYPYITFMELQSD